MNKIKECPQFLRVETNVAIILLIENDVNGTILEMKQQGLIKDKIYQKLLITVWNSMAVECGKCENWYHIKCPNTSIVQYEKSGHVSCYCFQC